MSSVSILFASVFLAAAPVLDPVQKQRPGSFFERVKAAADAGRYEEAEELLVAALEESPEYGDLMYWMGAVLAVQGKVNESLGMLEQALGQGFVGADSRREASFVALYGDPDFEYYLEQEREARLDRKRAARGGHEEVDERRAGLDRRARTELENGILWQDGHGAPVTRASFSADGTRILSSSDDGTVRLWDAYTREHLAVLGYHDATDLSAEFDSTGERVLVLDRHAGRASLWDGRSGELVSWLDRAGEFVLFAAFAPDGSTVVTAPDGGGVFFWDALEAYPLEDLTLETEGTAVVRHHPSGQALAVLASDGRIRLVDPESPALLGELPAGPTKARDMVFVAGGERLVVRGVGVRLWSFELDVEDPTSSKLVELPSSPWSLHDEIFDAEGRWILGVGPGFEIEIRDLATGELVRSLPHVRPCRLVGFSPGHPRVVTVNESSYMRLWDGVSGELLRRVGRFRTPIGIAVRRWSWSPEGERLAVGEHNYSVALLDGWTGRSEADLTGASGGTTYEIAFDPRGKRIVHGQYNGSLGLWDLDAPSKGEFLRRSLPAAVAETSPDRSRVFAWRRRGADRLDLDTGGTVQTINVGGTFIPASGDGYYTHDPGGGVTRRESDDATEPSWSVAGDGRRSGNDLVVLQEVPEAERVLSMGFEGTARILDRKSGRVILRVDGMGRGLRLREACGPRLSPDGRIFVGGGQVGQLVWWDERDGGEPVALPAHEGYIQRCVFTEDGRRLATVGWDGSARLWDTQSRETLFVLEGHTARVYDAAFTNDGELLATCAFDGTVRVWDTADGSELRVLRTEPGEELTQVLFHVVAAEVEGDARVRVIAAGSSGRIRIWDAASGEALAVLEGHIGGVAGLFLDPRGRLWSGSFDGSLRIWDPVRGALLATRITFDQGDWLSVAPSGHYIGTPRAADLTRVIVRSGLTGAAFPLSSYRTILESREKVADSLAGQRVHKPRLPSPPELDLDSPRSGLTRERSIVVDATASDRAGIEELSVWQDGAQVAAEVVEAALERDPSGRSARLLLELPISESRKDTHVRVRATNRRGILSRMHTARVVYEAAERDLYLLAMGVADYEEDDLDLAYPRKDVDDLVRRFQEEQGRLYTQVHVRRLVDGEVTPGKLRRAREEFLLRAEPEDTILVFAAGHGVRSDSGEYYFLTPRTTPDDPYEGIERQVLESLVTWDRLHADRRILLVDTCHSGEAFGEGKRGVALDSFDQREVDEAAGTGLYIIAASSEAGFAQEMEGNGLFTRALLEGLDGAADADGDGLVGIDELKIYATTAVHERSAGRQRPTAPRIEGGEDFPLARAR